jgi:hypothetical protein
MHATKSYIFLQVLHLIPPQEIGQHERLVGILETPKKGLHIVTGKHILLIIGDSDRVDG